MQQSIRVFGWSVAMVFCCCAFGLSQELDQPPPKKREPVLVSASERSDDPIGTRTIVLTLDIEPGVAIYTNEPHPLDADFKFLIPTTVEVLDEKGQVVVAEVKFPRGNLDESGMDGCQVYTKPVKVTAAFSAEVVPASVKLKYLGYRYSGSPIFGVS